MVNWLKNIDSGLLGLTLQMKKGLLAMVLTPSSMVLREEKVGIVHEEWETIWNTCGRHHPGVQEMNRSRLFIATRAWYKYDSEVLYFTINKNTTITEVEEVSPELQEADEKNLTHYLVSLIVKWLSRQFVFFVFFVLFDFNPAHCGGRVRLTFNLGTTFTIDICDKSHATVDR